MRSELLHHRLLSLFLKAFHGVKLHHIRLHCTPGWKPYEAVRQELKGFACGHLLVYRLCAACASCVQSTDRSCLSLAAATMRVGEEAQMVCSVRLVAGSHAGSVFLNSARHMYAYICPHHCHLRAVPLAFLKCFRTAALHRLVLWQRLEPEIGIVCM